MEPNDSRSIALMDFNKLNFKEIISNPMKLTLKIKTDQCEVNTNGKESVMIPVPKWTNFRLISTGVLKTWYSNSPKANNTKNPPAYIALYNHSFGPIDSNIELFVKITFVYFFQLV